MSIDITTLALVKSYLEKLGHGGQCRLETTTGGAVDQIPCVNKIDSRGYVSSWKFMSKQDLVNAVLNALPNGDGVSY